MQFHPFQEPLSDVVCKPIRSLSETDPRIIGFDLIVNGQLYDSHMKLHALLERNNLTERAVKFSESWRFYSKIGSGW